VFNGSNFRCEHVKQIWELLPQEIKLQVVRRTLMTPIYLVMAIKKIWQQ